METIILVAYLFAAIAVLVKGADYFVDGAKEIGLALGMSPFVVGVVIVGFGTSLPELASSIAGVLAGSPEIVIANVVGSNITNILLIIGLTATLGGTIVIKRDLLQTELPIFLIATIHFVAAIYDGVLDRVEAALLVGTFLAYLWYLYADSVANRNELGNGRPNIPLLKPILFVLGGTAAVLAGAHFTVLNAVALATNFSIPIGLVSIVAIAVGTSLPELFVSLKAMRAGESDLAIGNIFGSNAFNMLFVAGIPGLFAALPADAVVMEVGLGVLLAASIILFVNGLAKKVMGWEGAMLLLFYGFFMVKLAAFI
jgi:cation:H+ antiporter